jgi:hypothetical protein
MPHKTVKIGNKLTSRIQRNENIGKNIEIACTLFKCTFPPPFFGGGGYSVLPLNVFQSLFNRSFSVAQLCEAEALKDASGRAYRSIVSVGYDTCLEE